MSLTTENPVKTTTMHSISCQSNQIKTKKMQHRSTQIQSSHSSRLGLSDDFNKNELYNNLWFFMLSLFFFSFFFFFSFSVLFSFSLLLLLFSLLLFLACTMRARWRSTFFVWHFSNVFGVFCFLNIRGDGDGDGTGSGARPSDFKSVMPFV